MINCWFLYQTDRILQKHFAWMKLLPHEGWVNWVNSSWDFSCILRVGLHRENTKCHVKSYLAFDSAEILVAVSMNHLIAIIQSTQTIEREYCLVDSIASTKGTYALKDIYLMFFIVQTFLNIIILYSLKINK